MRDRLRSAMHAAVAPAIDAVIGAPQKDALVAIEHGQPSRLIGLWAETSRDRSALEGWPSGLRQRS